MTGLFGTGSDEEIAELTRRLSVADGIRASAKMAVDDAAWTLRPFYDDLETAIAAVRAVLAKHDDDVIVGVKSAIGLYRDVDAANRAMGPAKAAQRQAKTALLDAAKEVRDINSELKFCLRKRQGRGAKKRGGEQQMQLEGVL